jgi:hypothetical protein
MLHIINVRQSRETGNIGYTTRIKTKHIMCKNGHDLQLPVQSVPITTNVVSSNPVHGEVYSIQHYVIKSLAAGRWFSLGTPVSAIMI